MNRDVYNRRRRREDEYVSTMSTHPQQRARLHRALKRISLKLRRAWSAAGNIQLTHFPSLRSLELPDRRNKTTW